MNDFPPLPEAKHFYFAPEDTRAVRKPLRLFTSEQMHNIVAADRAQRQAGPLPDHPALHTDYPSEPLAALYGAFLALPACPLMIVVGNAIQEIQSLRQAEQEPITLNDKLMGLAELLGNDPQATRQIDARSWAHLLVYAPMPAAQPARVDEALRLAVERTREDLGPTGDNYPAVRKLLAFAEAHIAPHHPR